MVEFTKQYINCIPCFSCVEYPELQFVNTQGRFYGKVNGQYTSDEYACNGFDSLDQGVAWYLSSKSEPEVPDCAGLAELEEAMQVCGFYSTNNYVREYVCEHVGYVIPCADVIVLHDLSDNYTFYKYDEIARLILDVDSRLKQAGESLFAATILIDSAKRQSVMAAINTRDLTSDIVRVKSSNVWGYKFNVKEQGDNTGDLIVQFKGNNGGPGDVYIYYDVPVRVYRRWQSAPSVGHYFWVYIRNNFKYSKLTGNRRGKLPNAVN